MTRSVGVALAAAAASLINPGQAGPVRHIAPSDLAAVADLGGLSVSPDGQSVAVQVRRADSALNKYDISWQIVSVSSGRVQQFGDGGEPIQPTHEGRINGAIGVPQPAWSADSRSVAFVRRERRMDQIWNYRRGAERAEQLEAAYGEISALRYSLDGGRLYFMLQDRRDAQARLAQESRSGFLFDDRFVPSYSTTPVQAQSIRELWVFDFEKRQRRRADGDERGEYASLNAPSPPGKTVRGDTALSPAGRMAWTEALDPVLQGRHAPITVMVQDAAKNTGIPCAHAACTGQVIRDLWWHGDDTVVFARGEGHHYQDTVLYSWRIGTGAPRLLLRTSGRFTSPSNHEWRCTPVLSELICLFENQKSPRKLVAIDLDDGGFRTLFDPNPGFSKFDLGSVRRLALRTPSGIETYGELVLPPQHEDGQRRPLVVVTYRCDGFLRGGTGDEYPIFPLAAQGFAVLCFNAPDADYDRSAKMSKTEYQQWALGPSDPERHRVQESLEWAVARVVELGVVDPKRIAVTGLSFGAATVGYALFNMPNVTAVIASGPPGPSPADIYLAGPSTRESLRGYGFLEFRSTPERWCQVALSENAIRVRAPLLINTADREMLSALEAVTALQEAGRAVEMYVYPDEYHIKWQPAHRLAIYNRNIDWLNFWLRGVENSDAAKADQYRRWRAMRESQCRLFGGPDAPWYCHQDPDPSNSQK